MAYELCCFSLSLSLSSLMQSIVYCIWLLHWKLNSFILFYIIVKPVFFKVIFDIENVNENWYCMAYEQECRMIKKRDFERTLFYSSINTILFIDYKWRLQRTKVSITCANRAVKYYVFSSSSSFSSFNLLHFVIRFICIHFHF